VSENRGRVTNSTSINDTTESNHTGHRDRRGDLGDSMLVNSMHWTDGSVAPGFNRGPINTLPPGAYLRRYMNVRRPESEKVLALAVAGVRASQICDDRPYRSADLHSTIDHESSGSNAFISFAALHRVWPQILKRIYTHASPDRVRRGFLPS